MKGLVEWMCVGAMVVLWSCIVVVKADESYNGLLRHTPAPAVDQSSTLKSVPVEGNPIAVVAGVLTDAAVAYGVYAAVSGGSNEDNPVVAAAGDGNQVTLPPVEADASVVAPVVGESASVVPKGVRHGVESVERIGIIGGGLLLGLLAGLLTALAISVIKVTSWCLDHGWNDPRWHWLRDGLAFIDCIPVYPLGGHARVGHVTMKVWHGNVVCGSSWGEYIFVPFQLIKATCRGRDRDQTLAIMEELARHVPYIRMVEPCRMCADRSYQGEADTPLTWVGRVHNGACLSVCPECGHRMMVDQPDNVSASGVASVDASLNGEPGFVLGPAGVPCPACLGSGREGDKPSLNGGDVPVDKLQVAMLRTEFSDAVKEMADSLELPDVDPDQY